MGDMQAFGLGAHFESFIDRQTESGRYENARDVLVAALRLLEREEAKLDWLRQEIAKGEASGPAVPFDLDEFLAEMELETKDAP